MPPGPGWIGSSATHRRCERDGRSVLVKGSHIVVPQLFAHRFAYIFQNEDRRIVFAIPYEEQFTLIGTTDADYRGEPGDVRIEADEISYLCAIVNRYFTRPTEPADVIWSYSGVRPLLSDDAADPASVTRDYALELDGSLRRSCPCLEARSPPIASSPRLPWTCWRQSRETIAAAVDTRCQAAGRRSAWGQPRRFPASDGAALSLAARRPCAGVTRMPTERASSGSSAMHAGWPIWARSCLPDLYEREIDYLCREEFARTAEDILWRRRSSGCTSATWT